MPEPYLYIRAITFGLGTLWGILGLLRLYRFVQTWTAHVAGLGFEREWIRRQVIQFTLRTTICDPINLALLFTLFGTWMLRAWLEP